MNTKVTTTEAVPQGMVRITLDTPLSTPNGVISTTTYDLAQRVKDITHKKGASELERTVYSYDTNGNRTQQTRSVAASAPIQSESETTTYQYDNDDWLTQTATTRAIGPTSTTQTTAYTLDAVGNRTKEASTSSTASLAYVKDFTYDLRDRITTIATTGTGTGNNTAGGTNASCAPMRRFSNAWSPTVRAVRTCAKRSSGARSWP